MLKCNRCQGQGFYHNPESLKPHKFNRNIKCFDCQDCADCLGECVLDKKRIEELKLFAKQNKRATRGFPKTASLAPGLLSIPPMAPNFAPYQNGRAPNVPEIDADKLHPHLRGFLGIPIDENVLNIIKQVNVSISKAEVNEVPLLEQTSKIQTNCPRCEGKGFRHESSGKHDKKPDEKCKLCVQCRGSRS